MSATAGRPKVRLPLTPADIGLEVASAAGILLIFVITLLAWGNLPEKVPTHFNAAGKPDSYGDKWTIWLLPFINVAMYAGISAISRFPHVFNYLWTITPENAPRQYRLARLMMHGLKTVVVYMFLYIQWKGIEIAQGNSTELGWYFLPLSLVILTGSLMVYLRMAYKAR
jgi:uncharacterized membrane protein